MLRIDKMEFCPIPFNDEDRALAVRNLPSLSNSDYPAIDAICEATRLLFNCPTALVSAIYEDSQILPSAVGIEKGEVPRRISLCSFTIMSDEPMIVSDLSLDPKFSNHPMVVEGGPEYRFYVGVPLVLSSGFRLGSLCALDVKPHDKPSVRQIALLEELGKAVVAIFEQHSAPDHQDSEDKRVSNFITLVGHELRTPLTIILGALGLLQIKAADKGIQHLASSAKKATDHLASLIETIIEFSVVETGDLSLNEQPSRLSILANRTIEMVSALSQTGGKSISLDCRLEDIDLLIDPDQIQLCLTALLLNSVLHGGHEILVSIYRDHDGVIRIDVRDDGEFEATDGLQNLHKPFVVGEELDRRKSSGGLGLGLPLTRKIIEMHSGKFEVFINTSSTTASIRLPSWREVKSHTTKL